jgi:hypothetical protein
LAQDGHNQRNSHFLLNGYYRGGLLAGDAEIGWRPTPEKNIETMPRWGKKIAQRISSWTWDVTHERALSPADLFGGKAPVGALIGLLERIR